jgi:hypothetical protein
MNNIISNFYLYFQQIARQLQRNFRNIPAHLLSILLGFLIGNLFAILTKSFFSQINIIFCLVLCEIITITRYSFYQSVELKIQPSSMVTERSQQGMNKKLLSKKVINFLNLLKRGFLIGIFLEAFKVGS